MAARPISCSGECRTMAPRSRGRRAPSASRRTGSRWRLPARSWCSISAPSGCRRRAGRVRDAGQRWHRAPVPLPRAHRGPARAPFIGERARRAGGAAGGVRFALAGAAEPAQRGFGGRLAVPSHHALLSEPAPQPPHRSAPARGSDRAGVVDGSRRRRGGARRAAPPPCADAHAGGGGGRPPSPGRDDARGGRRATRLLPAAGGLLAGARPAIARAPGGERMSTRPAEGLWLACLSALHLDRFLMGELNDAEAERVRAHLEECSHCSEAVGALRMAREERLPPLRLVPLAPRPRPRLWRRAAAAGLALAAAASVVLVLRPPGERVKGPGFALRMYVEHEGQVRRAGP